MSTVLRLSCLLLATALPLPSLAALPAETITPSINAELAEHTKHFAQKVASLLKEPPMTFRRTLR